MSGHYNRNNSNHYRNSRGWDDRPPQWSYQRDHGRGRGRSRGGWGGRSSWQDRPGDRSFQRDRVEAEHSLPWERRPNQGTASTRPQESPFPFGGNNVNPELDRSRPPETPAPETLVSDVQPTHSDATRTMSDIVLPPPPIDAPTEDRRRETLDRLSKLRSGEERFGEYSKLPQHERLVLCLRDDVSYGALPIQDYPDDWPDRVSQAIDSTKSAVTDFHKKRSRDVYEASDSDGSSEDGMFSSRDVAKSEIRRAENFAASLKYCPELTLGFLAPMVTGQYNTSWCYCPCGLAMKTWRKFAGVEAFLHDKQCDYKGKKRPFELLRHVQAKAKAGCLAHQLIEHYLNKVFENFYGPGYRHIAFANVDDPEYRRIERYLLKKTDKLIEGLRQEQQRMRDLERRLQQSELAQAELKKYNEDLASKLQAEQQLKEQFKAKAETNQTPEEVQSVLDQTKEFRKFSLGMLGHNPNSPPKLKINWTPATFDISKAMEEWYKCYYISKDFKTNDAFPYLFAEKGDDIRPSWSQQKINVAIASKWTVVSHKEDDGMEKYERKDKDRRAEDEGGPTREFFNKIWNQLADLHIDGVQLFDKSDGGLVPVQSGVFVGKKSQEWYVNKLDRISRYYRAFGRILAHCFLLEVPIADFVLPKLYMTKLFRGLDPSCPTYYSGPLIEDLMSIMDLGSQSSKAALLKRLGLPESENDIAMLREKANQVYFEERGTSLIKILEGINLDGALPLFLCFRLVPTKTISQIAFASQKFTYDMIFNSDGEFRFIHPAQDNWEHEKSEMFCEHQAQFWPNFVDWFKHKLESHPEFIASFFHLVTGMSYIPDVAYNPDFNIKVEFNATEMGTTGDFLPVIHTCVNTIKIPANAYDGDIEKFEEMLERTMSHASGNFDMK